MPPARLEPKTAARRSATLGSTAIGGRFDEEHGLRLAPLILIHFVSGARGGEFLSKLTFGNPFRAPRRSLRHVLVAMPPSLKHSCIRYTSFGCASSWPAAISIDVSKGIFAEFL